ncbi:hypothetical protein PIB30_011756 [Stylosanthes scabra]|uniref:Uncharacterized protein n=1 Tax=Stylosanthes scabra TaxID=79078 RepID=A0ABU6Q6P2_9FABA|nr:hypothetical protein [Stylosanthes scabra]
MALSHNHCRRFYCGDGSPTRRSSKAPKTSTLIRLSRSLGNSRKVCYRETKTRFLESVGPTTSPSIQSLCSTLGEGVSSMHGGLIDFKAQLTSQGNELRGLRNDLRGCPVISS